MFCVVYVIMDQICTHRVARSQSNTQPAGEGCKSAIRINITVRDLNLIHSIHITLIIDHAAGSLFALCVSTS